MGVVATLTPYAYGGVMYTPTRTELATALRVLGIVVLTTLILTMVFHR